MRGEIVDISVIPRRKKKLSYWYADAVDSIYGDFANGIRARKDDKEWNVSVYESAHGVGHVIAKPTIAGHPLPSMHYVILDRPAKELSKQTGKPFRVFSKGFAPLAELPSWSKPFPRRRAGS